MNPIIGIISAVDAAETTSVLPAYVRCIEQAGGTPLVLPYTTKTQTIQSYVTLCDGFLFSGGVDISPTRYGEMPTSRCATPSLPFDEFAFLVFSAALTTKKPILGVCRGAQMINIALGGTLYQDLPTQHASPILHQQREPKFSFSHEVSLVKDGPLARLLGTERSPANSFHHQAIKRLGDGLTVMATADDGTVEAIYAPSHPYLFGIQWHPERLIDIDEHSRNLFSHFIQTCEERK